MKQSVTNTVTLQLYMSWKSETCIKTINLLQLPFPGLLSCTRDRDLIVTLTFINILQCVQVLLRRWAKGIRRWYLLAWSVGFINFPLLVEEVERRPIVSVFLLHPKMFTTLLGERNIKIYLQFEFISGVSRKNSAFLIVQFLTLQYYHYIIILSSYLISTVLSRSYVGRTPGNRNTNASKG